MPITSLAFLIFLFGVFILYFLLPQKIKAPLLLLASLFFYYSWAKWAPLFMVFYALYVYLAARLIDSRKNRKFYFLITCVGICIAAFLLLRYTALPDLIVNALTSPFGISASIVFPLGFSYYMFKSISYLIDVYFGKLNPEKRYDYLLLHLCFFPEISMGPITRASDFLPQIRQAKKFDANIICQSSVLILWGFFKKLVLADRLAITVNAMFGDMGSQNGLAWLIIAFAYVIQLYLDFSGYTDISVAVSEILGYKIKHNFNAPFFSQTISEFWRNWHMSLSGWLLDYIFTPLQFVWRKYGVYASVFAALITLIISGFWHGASSNYLIYGFLMGCFVSFDVLFAKKRKSLKKDLPKTVFMAGCIALTIFINIILIIFTRSGGTHNALVIILKYIFDPTTWSLNFGLGKKFFVTLAVGVTITACSHVIELNRECFFSKLFALPLIVRWVIYYSVILILMFFGVYTQSGFIYFQF